MKVKSWWVDFLTPDFLVLGQEKKNAFKLLDIVLLNEITQQKLIIWPLLLLSTKCSRRHLWLLKPPTELGKQSSQNIMKPAFADV